MAQHEIGALLEVSRRYGTDARYVLLGGGNTSYKIDDVMYVKASGHALGTIAEDGFVAMSMPRLMAIWEKTYPADTVKREEEVLADLMGARSEGQTGRPSVEALLHGIIPFTYVVHLHPAMVNGLTCGQSGKEWAQKLFPDAIWIPLVNPGYILAKTVRDAQQEYVKSHANQATTIFLQNHGVFVASDTIGEIDALYTTIMETLNHAIVRKPVFSEVKVDAQRVDMVQQAMQLHYGSPKTYPVIANREVANRLTDPESFSSISSAYTPDHIVYSGFKPLWIDETVFGQDEPVQAMVSAMRTFEQMHGVPAKIIAVQKTAAFAVSEAALVLFLDTVKVSAFTESFGGPRFMDDDQIDFIRTWEVEQYRSNLNA